MCSIALAVIIGGWGAIFVIGVFLAICSIRRGFFRSIKKTNNDSKRVKRNFRPILKTNIREMGNDLGRQQAPSKAANDKTNGKVTILFFKEINQTQRSQGNPHVLLGKKQ